MKNKDIWKVESDEITEFVWANSPEEAVKRLNKSWREDNPDTEPLTVTKVELILSHNEII